jgi:hypothetical protein
MNAEQQNQQRRHQRATADAGQPDQDANDKPGRRIKRLEVLDRTHALLRELRVVLSAILAGFARCATRYRRRRNIKNLHIGRLHLAGVSFCADRSAGKIALRLQ